jgi:hypothetical protein
LASVAGIGSADAARKIITAAARAAEIERKHYAEEMAARAQAEHDHAAAAAEAAATAAPAAAGEGAPLASARSTEGP